MAKKPQDRYDWLMKWMGQGGSCTYVDILDSDLVLAYIEATGAASCLQHIGGPKCPQLGRDLAAMHTAGTLDRNAVGLSAGDSSMGFPKWVYSYSVKDNPTR